MEQWAVDCHVHFYDMFNINLAVDTSWQNVKRLERGTTKGQCWCLTSAPGIDGIASLNAAIERQKSEKQILVYSDDTGQRVARIETPNGPILIVPGTQAISSEGLEVLSLGVEIDVKQKIGIRELVTLISHRGGLPVVPWGVGKWIGRRGDLVQDLVADLDSCKLLLADNANRPWWWRYPKLLAEANSAGISVVHGSDPLPIAKEEERIGSAGILCSVRSLDTAWTEIRTSLLAHVGASTNIYGKPLSNMRFWRNQILLRAQAQRK